MSLFVTHDIMSDYRLIQRCLKQMQSHALLLSIATMGVVSGVVPEISVRSQIISFSSAAYAQDISNTEITNYAKAVLLMEPVRQSAFNEIKQIIGSGDIPPIVCSQPETLNALPKKAQGIAVTYCESSKKIVENNGIPIKRFNAITSIVQNDANLKNRIQSELIRLQSSGK